VIAYPALMTADHSGWRHDSVPSTDSRWCVHIVNAGYRIWRP